MNLRLDYSDAAKKHLEFFRKSGNKKLLLKIAELLYEISENPFDGTGKPEQLRYEYAGFWSRRINREHRLVYKVFDEFIRIYSLKGHYEK